MTRLQPALYLFVLCVLLLPGCAPTGTPAKPGGAKIPVVELKNPNRIQKAKKNDSGPDLLKQRLEEVLSDINERELEIDHAFWTVIHGILANGLDAKLRDPLTNRRVNAIDYIRQGGRPNGLKFEVKTTGVDVRLGPPRFGQGHKDQFIGELAQCGMSKDAVFIINKKKYRFEDFLRHAKADTSVTKGQELSWTLVALSQYYGTQMSWTNQYGEKLHFKDAVKYELEQPITTMAACGGTHRLFGLTWSYHIHRKTGGGKTGVWLEVAKTIEKFKQRAREVQNPDRSFSTKYFEEKENIMIADRRIGCTGHIVEWLALCLRDDELQQAWMQDAVHALIRLILDNRNPSVDAGSVYHAAHGLRLYYDRVYGSSAQEKSAPIAPPPPAD